jgi:hypothetical protein
MLVDQPASHLLLATGEGVGPKGLAEARRGDTVVLAIEPAASIASDLDSSDKKPGGGFKVVPMPWMRMCPAWLSAAEPQEALGTLKSLQVTAIAPPSIGSLYARLYDAMNLVVHLMGVPATIDAALTGPLAEPAEDLRRVTGHMTAHLRFGNGGSAILQVSDRAATWHRSLIALGTEAQLMLSDHSYHLIGNDGQDLDRLEPESDAPVDPVDLITLQWKRLVDRPTTIATIEPRVLISCCQTALLSCRTGGLESPETLIHMSGG